MRRGSTKSCGERLPKCGTEQVSRELAAKSSAELREDVLGAVAKEIESLNERIKEYAHTDGENRQGELPAGGAATEGLEGGRQALYCRLRPNPRRPDRFAKSREVGCSRIKNLAAGTPERASRR